jgi:hypothetical protein
VASPKPRSVDHYLTDLVPSRAEPALAPRHKLKEGFVVSREIVPIAELSKRWVVAFDDDGNVDGRHDESCVRKSQPTRKPSLLTTSAALSATAATDGKVDNTTRTRQPRIAILFPNLERSDRRTAG